MSIPDSGDFDHARAPYPAPQATLPAGPARLFRWYDVLLLGLILLLSQFIPGVIAGAVGLLTGSLTMENASAGQLPTTVIMIAVAGSGIVMVLGCMLLRWMRHIDWSAVGVRATTGRALLAAVLAFVIYIAIAEGIGRVIEIDPEGELARQLMQQLIPANASVPFLVMAVAFIGVIVPAAEELLFRGFLITWLRERSNAAIAVIVSAAIFAVVHGYFMTSEFEFGLFATAQIFVLGLLLGWLAAWSRSLWPPILLHVVNNVVTIAVTIWGAPV
jgi:membrane protease YdiL (CAAX protease family)